MEVHGEEPLSTSKVIIRYEYRLRGIIPQMKLAAGKDPGA